MVELNYSQSLQLLLWFGGSDTNITIQEKTEGHEGAGTYAWITDYPEEGSFRLDPDLDVKEVKRRLSWEFPNG